MTSSNLSPFCFPLVDRYLIVMLKFYFSQNAMSRMMSRRHCLVYFARKILSRARSNPSYLTLVLLTTERYPKHCNGRRQQVDYEMCEVGSVKCKVCMVPQRIRFRIGSRIRFQKYRVSCVYRVSSFHQTWVSGVPAFVSLPSPLFNWTLIFFYETYFWCVEKNTIEVQ
jgi:hypothetical protein